MGTNNAVNKGGDRVQQSNQSVFLEVRQRLMQHHSVRQLVRNVDKSIHVQISFSIGRHMVRTGGS